jgi:hypothetical protein
MGKHIESDAPACMVKGSLKEFYLNAVKEGEKDIYNVLNLPLGSRGLSIPEHQ